MSIPIVQRLVFLAVYLRDWLVSLLSFIHPIHFHASLINLFYIALEWFAAKFTDRIIAISSGEKSAALKAKVCHTSMMKIIENGVNTKAFQIEADLSKIRKEFNVSDGQQVVGTVARFCPQKGYEQLIRAAREVINMYPQIRFLLVGDGELMQTIKNMIERLGLSRNIIITGQRSDLPELYALMDLFVLPSLWEGLPYSILEAMAAGRPIIATTFNGTEGIVIDGRTGILVPSEDTEALSQAVIKLLKVKKLAEKMGQEGRRHVKKKYQLKNHIRKLESFYIKMVEKN